MVLGSCELDIRDKHSCKGSITHGSYVRKRFERLR